MRILIVINDSPITEGVLQCSAQITGRSDPDSTIMMVIPHNKSGELLQAERVLNQAQHVLGINQINKKVRVGSFIKELLKESNEGAYELIILGYPSYSAKNCTNPKSILTRIAEGVPCSILIVQGLLPRINRVLMCDSGASAGSALRDFTIKLLDLINEQEQITVLHVMSQVSAGPGILGEQLRSDAEKLISSHTPEGDLLERDLQQFSQAGSHPAPKVRHGLVVDEILDEARKGEYDLVIIGAHNPTGWQKFLLDNLARKILSQIDRSLLIVKTSSVT